MVAVGASSSGGGAIRGFTVLECQSFPTKKSARSGSR